MQTNAMLRAALVAALSCAVLAACSGNGEREVGIEASLRATPMGSHTASHDGGGAGHADYRQFRRADGMRIDLQLGLVNLVPIALEACPTASAGVGRVLAMLNPMGAAVAHAGHGGSPPAGAVNAVAEGEGVVDLGALIAGPGSYCGLRVALQPGSAAAPKHGGELDTSLDGVAINVAPCYYPDTVGVPDTELDSISAHSCVQAKAAAQPRRITLPFSAPVTLDAEHRQLDLTVVLRYEEWFDGIDMTQLADAAAEQARLVDNILAAMHVHTGDEQNLALAFAAEVNGDQAMCGAAYEGVGSTAQDYELRDFRWYVSDLELRGNDGVAPVRLAPRADGTVHQQDGRNVALLGLVEGCDAPAPARTLALAGAAAAGDFDQLCFTLGVPADRNHGDIATAPTPLNSTAMAWSWLGGRKFVRVDGIGDADGARQNFFVHLGSTGCTNGTGDPTAPPDGACAQPNQAEICLDYTVIAEGGRIVADIAPVLADTDIGSDAAGAPGCMSGTTDPECLGIVPRFGLDFTYNGQPIPRQDQQFLTLR